MSGKNGQQGPYGKILRKKRWMLSPEFGIKSPWHQYELGTDGFGSGSAEKTLKVLVHSELCMSWVLVYWVLVKPHLECSFAPQNKKDTAKLGQVQQRAPKIARAGALALWGEAGGSWACLAWSRSGFRGTYELAASTQQEVRARLLRAVHSGRMCNNSHKLKREKVHAKYKETLFPPVRPVRQWNCLQSWRFSRLDWTSLTSELLYARLQSRDPWSPFQPQLSDDGVLLSPSAPKENEIILFSPIQINEV